RAIAPALPLVAVSLLDAAARPGPAGRRPLSALQTMGAAFLTIMAQQTRAAIALDPPDVLIRPAIGHLSTGAFTRAAELIALGRAATIAALPRIRAALAARN
ncbi:hypothetical protein, partial [Sphingomonas bacterium]|uniref:hypothetical protein n=1 Tax=Sphingomonas bacterium TaxID=1895847 RepID=UPI003F689839